MIKISLSDYSEATKNTRSRISVASKLDTFLLANLVEAKKNDTFVINVSDFCEASEAHYYTALKMLKAKYNSIIEWKFILKEHARFEKIYIKVK